MEEQIVKIIKRNNYKRINTKDFLILVNLIIAKISISQKTDFQVVTHLSKASSNLIKNNIQNDPEGFAYLSMLKYKYTNSFYDHLISHSEMTEIMICYELAKEAVSFLGKRYLRKNLDTTINLYKKSRANYGK